MIDVEAVLDALPRAVGFRSVENLLALVRQLDGDTAFKVTQVGMSVKGTPIQHVRFGSGSVKALIVGGPHAPEPIGTGTVAGLLTLLQQRHRELLTCDVEWHIVPCIDPDGATLNEEWTLRPFSFERCMKHYHLQRACDQVDGSFPIQYKKMHFNRPSQEAAVLKRLLDKIRPDFYFPLHNGELLGSFFLVSHDIGSKYYQQLRGLTDRHGLPLRQGFTFDIAQHKFAEGVFRLPTIRDYYDYLEGTVADPAAQLADVGATSAVYLSDRNPAALTFIGELAYGCLPDPEAIADAGKPLRYYVLRAEAESRCVVSTIMEEWENVKSDVDPESPFYPAIFLDLVCRKDALLEGGPPIARYQSRETLFDAKYARAATRSDRFDACMLDGGYFLLRNAYQFVRLLNDSKQTAAVKRAILRLEPVFDAALHELDALVHLDEFACTAGHTLIRAQLGSGLIALNSILERRADFAPVPPAVGHPRV